MRVYRCPCDATTTNDAFYGPGNYATNNLLLGQRVRFKAQALPDGSELPASCPDGLSHTILFAEKYAACSYWALSEGSAVPWYVADQRSGFQVQPATCDPRSPQTPHRRGIQVAMLDGRVRVIDRSIGPAEWLGLNTPAGND